MTRDIFATPSVDTGSPVECTLCGVRNVNPHTHARWHKAQAEKLIELTEALKNTPTLTLAEIQQWIEHNRKHTLRHLDMAEGDKNHIRKSVHRAELDLINRLERQLVPPPLEGATWKIP